jgi:large subunit ribosomal protein L3
VAIELLCTKLGMTRIFAENGESIPVTVLDAAPNTVVQKKTGDPEKKNRPDGYEAIQLGVGERRESLFSKAELGHFKAAGVEPKRVLRESRVDSETLDQHELGQMISCEIFEAGQKVDVTGTSKGRGFAGVVKRHGMAIKKRTHGTHEFFRHGGSIGAGASPGHVIKGMKMAGQMGNERVTVKNLEVVRVDAEKNLLFLRGGLPGAINGIVAVRTAVGHGS